MTAFVTLDSLSVAAPDGHRLFEGLTLACGRERIGVVGRNGSGKSTLLRVIAGELEPAAGAVQRAGSIGVLLQALNERLSAAEALGVSDGLARLRRLEAGEGSEEDLAEADWTLEARLDAVLDEAGLAGLSLDRPVSSLSGGQRTRLALARLLVEAPDLLLLDEPTNNLDAEGRAAVARLLEGWRGGAIVASHDRELLARVDRIVELSPVAATVFGGPWPAFVAARDAARARAEDEVERAGHALKRAEREAQAARERQDRRDKAGRAKRAKGDAPKILLDAKAGRAEQSAGRLSHLADRIVGGQASALEAARSRVEVLTPLAIDLPRPGVPSGRELIAVEGVVAAAGGRRLFGPLSFQVRGPERIAVAGGNGAGKTTLLRMIAGEREPDQGRLRRLTDRIAVLDQHVAVLDPEASVLDNLRRLNPGLSENEARATLARFAFRNRAALKPAAELSGGERMRAGLACAFAGPPPELLLLDEPTNHLDLEAVEVLERALSGYDGALIAVSHDAAFLKAVGAERVIALTPAC